MTPPPPSNEWHTFALNTPSKCLCVMPTIEQSACLRRVERLREPAGQEQVWRGNHLSLATPRHFPVLFLGLPTSFRVTLTRKALRVRVSVYSSAFVRSPYLLTDFLCIYWALIANNLLLVSIYGFCSQFHSCRPRSQNTLSRMRERGEWCPLTQG